MQIRKAPSGFPEKTWLLKALWKLLAALCLSSFQTLPVDAVEYLSLPTNVHLPAHLSITMSFIHTTFPPCWETRSQRSNHNQRFYQHASLLKATLITTHFSEPLFARERGSKVYTGEPNGLAHVSTERCNWRGQVCCVKGFLICYYKTDTKNSFGSLLHINIHL